MGKLDNKDIYYSYVQLAMHAETTSWNRFYNYLMAMTFLILAWVTLYVQGPNSCTVTLILVSVCVIGFGCGLLWAAIGYRGRRFMAEYTTAGSKIEEEGSLWDSESVSYKPLSQIKNLRDSLPFRYAGSFFLLIGVPLAFTVLYSILLVASITR